MAWNWELVGWPKFEWNPELLRVREQAFIENAAISVGTMRHLGKDDREEVVIELLSSDALSTSAIEGEVLDRESVQSSLRRQLGMSAAAYRSRPAEAGIAEMMADLYRHPLDPITAAATSPISAAIAAMTKRCRLSQVHSGASACTSKHLHPNVWQRR
jgi:Fic family protein